MHKKPWTQWSLCDVRWWQEWDGMVHWWRAEAQNYGLVKMPPVSANFPPFLHVKIRKMSIIRAPWSTCRQQTVHTSSGLIPRCLLSWTANWRRPLLTRWNHFERKNNNPVPICFKKNCRTKTNKSAAGRKKTYLCIIRIRGKKTTRKKGTFAKNLGSHEWQNA